MPTKPSPPLACGAPGHCTGEPTFTALKRAFTDRYLDAGLGTTFALGATPRPFEDYIRRALVDELKVAEMLSDSAPVTLTGNLDKIDFNSMAGARKIDLTATPSNGGSLRDPSKYGLRNGPGFLLAHEAPARAERGCPETD